MDLLDILLGAKFGRGSGGGGSSSFIPSFGTVASVNLGTTWAGNDPYTSTVTVTGYTVTDKTMVSVLPSTAVLTQMLADGTSNIFITNNNGTLTATALGAAPTQAMTLTVLCSESDQTESISALPSIVGDGVIETLQANDLTDAVNQLGGDVSDVKNAIDANEASFAPVETTSTASRAYAVDDLLVYQNRLYKVTSQIVAGGTLTVGTNIVATTVEDEIANVKQTATANPVTMRDYLWSSVHGFSSDTWTDDRDGMTVDNNLFVVPYGSSTSLINAATVFSGSGGYRKVNGYESPELIDSDFVPIAPFRQFNTYICIEYRTNMRISGTNYPPAVYAYIKQEDETLRRQDFILPSGNSHINGKLTGLIETQSGDTEIAFTFRRGTRARSGGTYIINFYNENPNPTTT